MSQTRWVNVVRKQWQLRFAVVNACYLSLLASMTEWKGMMVVVKESVPYFGIIHQTDTPLPNVELSHGVIPLRKNGMGRLWLTIVL